MHIIIKRITIAVLLFCCSYAVQAQTLPDFDLIKLDQLGDYKKAEPFALQTANFLLIVPYKSSTDDKERGKAIEFLAKWVGGVQEYPFSFDQVQKKITKADIGLLEMYLASMIKYAVENKAAAKEAKNLKLNAITILLTYCENKDNNLKMNKPLKKLEEAKQKGELETALTKMLD